jgi:hypothetical protein
LVDVAEFRTLILDKRLQMLFDYWHRIRLDRVMPDWADIRPEEVAPVLPFTWAWRLDEGGDLRLRLAGESIVEVLEFNIRGKTPFDLYSPQAALQIDARFRKVITAPTCSFTIGPVQHDGKAIGLGQRLVLPYGDPKPGKSGVIGASTLEKHDRGADGGSTLYELVGEEYFLSLA